MGVAPTMFQQPDGTWMMAPTMPEPMAALDHTQGKWFAPGEPLPPGFVATSHPEGLTQPLDTHAMSELVKSSGSFVVTGMAAPADTAAAAVDAKALPAATAAKAKKSKKSKKSHPPSDAAEFFHAESVSVMFVCH